MATGLEGSAEPVGQVRPAWDCITEQRAALGIIGGDWSAGRHAH